MEKLKKINFHKIEDINLGNKLFLIGIFFLPSALPISGLFLLFSLIISFNKESISIKDKWNYPLFFSIGIILFGTLNISFLNKPSVLSEYNISTIWLNLFNWVPIFLYYWGFQSFLRTEAQRLIFLKVLVSGSFPVIISFILQKYFSFYGPYKTLFGLIVWFQKPIINNGAASGLFSNPNYAAIWLVLLLPFTIALFKLSKGDYLKKYIMGISSFLITYMILLTGSRNGIIGIFITYICIYGYKRILIILGSLISILTTIKFFELLLSIKLPIFSTFLPESIFLKIKDLNSFSSPRFEIWQSTVTRIQERPFLGWGPSTFSFLNLHNNSKLDIPYKIIDAHHSHNIVLELAHNFGLPLSLILSITVVALLYKSWIKIFIKKISNNEPLLLKKAWFCSTTIFVISHLSDITLYDGKISILISILLAGLKSLLNENSKKPLIN